MLVENLIKKTVELQGFRVVTVQKTERGLEAKLAPDCQELYPEPISLHGKAAFAQNRAYIRVRNQSLFKKLKRL